MAIELGIKGSSSCTVTSDLTAKSLRSGGLDVLATPIMVALMEEAALLSADETAEEAEDSAEDPPAPSAEQPARAVRAREALNKRARMRFFMGIFLSSQKLC